MVVSNWDIKVFIKEKIKTKFKITNVPHYFIMQIYKRPIHLSSNAITYTSKSIKISLEEINLQ